PRWARPAGGGGLNWGRRGRLGPPPAWGGGRGLGAGARAPRLGGPRYYQGQLVRFPVFDEGSEPDANLPLRLLQRLQLTGWGWLGLSLLLTWMALNHG
ncbi:hypothetical protein U1620_21160, partial [Aeromonas caviae]